MSIEVPFVIGHRGAAGLAPENTLVSLRRARIEGARWVEFDVMLSGDGVALLFHDDTLNRTTNGKGLIAKHDFSDLRELDAGSWFNATFAGERIPSFAETIDVLAAEGLGANVEIKPTPGLARETAEAACRMIMENWPDSMPLVISSFEKDAMAVARDMLPDRDRAMLFNRLPKNWQSVVGKLDCNAVHVSNRSVTEKVVEAVRTQGLPVRVYTVNDPLRAETLREWGVSSVFTDRPDLIRD
ncbi:MAG: glycerophosphodiester phosphodiesterase [Rhodospirillales bacterium]